jgi:hypothetical protein
MLQFDWLKIFELDCHKKNFKVIFNNCHLFMTLIIGLHHFFFRNVKKMLAKIPCPEFYVSAGNSISSSIKIKKCKTLAFVRLNLE